MLLWRELHVVSGTWKYRAGRLWHPVQEPYEGHHSPRQQGTSQCVAGRHGSVNCYPHICQQILQLPRLIGSVGIYSGSGGVAGC